MLYKTVSEPPLGLTDVQEATSGEADAVDHVDGCAGAPLSNVEGLFCALNGGERGGVGAGGKLQSLKYEDTWDVQEWNAPTLGADAAEAEELGVGDCILAG
eukprot:g32493.t1